MPRSTRQLGRRPGPWAMALLLYDVWRRIPPKQRQRILAEVRTHGPRVARDAIARSPPRRGGAAPAEAAAADPGGGAPPRPPRRARRDRPQPRPPAAVASARAVV